MSDLPEIIRDVETRLRAAGVSVAQVCRRADLDRTAWQRWKTGGVPPRKRNWAAVRDVLRPIIGEVPELPGAAPPSPAESAPQEAA